MKRSTFRSAFFSPRVLIALLLCAAGAGLTSSGTLLALSQHEAPGRVQRTLTLQERVSYQRAIEEVYWRHRIWPKENANPKPSLDAVMSQSQLEKKVTDYLRNSLALEDYWQRSITAQQLQAEMDRMATHTKQPEVLQELFEALGNDPFVIAECLARPALADRLITNWYGYDQRIQLSGKYSETEFVRSDGAGNGTNRNAEHSVKLNSREWDETMHKLAASFGARRHAAGFQSADMSAHSISAANDAYEAVPVGNVGPLQEDEERYYATAVIEKSNDAVNLATVSWPKEQLEAWLARAGNQPDTAMTEPSGNYTLPEILDGAGCIGDTWTTTAGPPDGRDGHTAVWTGNEMIIWGGTGSGLNTGARYNPSTDSWTATSTTNAPTARLRHTAVWTGSEMIIWGGESHAGPQRLYWNTGGRYNPSTNSWTATRATNAPSARSGHSAVWTGSEMIVWGGSNDTTVFNTGGRYNRSTNSWTATATVNAPTARYGASTVWTGSEMIVWGGYNSDTYFNTGGRYNPSTNSWTSTSTINAPSGRWAHTVIWTGSEMIAWGGYDGFNVVNTGGRYNPATNSWATTSTINAPIGRNGHTAVWTGSQMIIWGGIGGGQLLGNGGRYNPGTNSWTLTTTTNAPAARFDHTAIWTGTEMVVWSGYDFGGITNTGGRYNPSTDSWTATGTANAPQGRSAHTAVWTGSEMIVWGGAYFDTGGRYTPSTDSWAATSTSGAPRERAVHTAVWTGSEMMIWGGEWYNGAYQVWNTGGRYNPGTDSWTATSITNAPTARELHGAVWTGSEMIVWGGTDENLNPFDTGGRYNPSTNTWAPTPIANAPSSRRAYGWTIWTGSEMIVWGGYGTFYTGYLNTGGRYNPVTDVWTATSTSNAPSARSAHRAVWTGKEMIIWGGWNGNGNFFTSGGRYNPSTDSWAATSTMNAPPGGTLPTAVWTGNEMIVWGGYGVHPLNTGGSYTPSTDGWVPTSTVDAPETRYGHTAVWTGNEMIVWGGFGSSGGLNSGGRYCPPTPCTGRCSPTPRPRPTPAPRP